MSTPKFLDEGYASYRYLQVAGVTDVATIITSIRSELVTNGSWTEPVSGTFQSPTTDGGQWMSIALTRISATTLEALIKDQTGFTVDNGRMVIVSGDNVDLFTGKMHFYCLKVTNSGNCDHIKATILEQSPNAQSINSNATFAFCSRDTASTLRTNSYTASRWYSNEAGVATVANRTIAVHALNNYREPITRGGRYLVRDTVGRILVAGTNVVGGRLPHVLTLPGSVAQNTDLYLYIDTTTKVLFNTTSLSPLNNTMYAIRKGPPP